MKNLRVLAAVLILPALLSLGSCGVLSAVFASFFPADLGHASARTDLSSLIPDEADAELEFSVVRAGTPPNDYVMLLSKTQYSGPHVIAFDSELSTPPLLTLRSLPSGFAGGFAMADNTGSIVFGNQVFDPNGSSPAVIPTQLLYGWNVILSEYSVFMPSEDCYAVNLQMPDAHSISCDLFDSSWVSAGLGTVVISTDPIYDFFLIAIYAHLGQSQFYVLIGEKNSGTMICFTVAFDILTGSSPIMVPPGGLFEIQPSLFTIPFIANNVPVGFSGNSLIVYGEQTREWTVYEIPTGRIRMTRIEPLRLERLTVLFSASTPGYFILDREQQTVTKYEAWWPR